MYRWCVLCVLAVSIGGATPHETIRQLNLFSEVFRYIKNKSVRPVSDEALITQAIQGMLSAVDGHSTYITMNRYQDLLGDLRGQFAGIGVEFTEKNGQPTVISPLDNSPAAHAGVQAGDILLEIDGAPILGLSLDEIRTRLKGDPGEALSLKVRRNEDEKTFALKRAPIHLNAISHYEKDNIVVIRLSHFQEGAAQKLKALLRSPAVKKARAIILDLTNNPGGIFEEALDVSNLFLEQGIITSVQARDKADQKVYYAQKQHTLNAHTPLYIFVNKGTASSAEIVASALMENGRAHVLGQKTFGKGSVQTIIPVPPGYTAVQLTTGLYKTPKGQILDGKGVTPQTPIEVDASNRETWKNHMIDTVQSKMS